MQTGLLLLVAAVAMLTAIGTGWRRPRVWLIANLAGAGAVLVAAVAVLAGGADWVWRSGFAVGGERLLFRLDAISALFLALLCVVGGAATVYAGEYWTEAAHPRSARSGRVWWSVMLLALGWVLLSSNGLHFLIGWEIFTVAAYFLVTLNRQSREVRAAGWLYLAASHAAVLALFAFFSLLALRTGSWDLGPLRERTDLASLFWLALCGFGLKAGMFPLHIWLPSAHANAPSHVSAMLSGVTLKIGIYGLVRFSGWLPVPPAAGPVVAMLGVVSAVLGVAFALGQHDLKRLLAYHSVENIGIILIGLGFALVAAGQGSPAWGRLALAGGLLHVWNHGLFKALLFFGAGSVLHTTGTREMSRLGGLWRAMPWTAGWFALGAVAISGLPPLNGFVSEWLVYLGLFDATLARGPLAWAAMPAAILLGVTGALALACFVKVCGVVFLGAARSGEAVGAHECGPSMRGAMAVLGGLCVAIGLAPLVLWPAIARAAGAWNPAWAGTDSPAPLLQLGWLHVGLAAMAAVAGGWLWRRVCKHGLTRGPTWDCGYAAPTARMQYTAGSFAGIITEWFAVIVRPERHEQRPEGDFPAAASLTDHTPETVLERVLEPAARGVLRVSWLVRRLQHGRVQAYVLYLLIGLVVLAAWACAAGVPLD
ncbi:MAG: proton-conducting transporter membrane subunit [Verrucomicrobiota bacterium]